MAAPSHKKVLIARFEKAPQQGFLQLPEGLRADTVELVNPDGNLLAIPLAEVRLICFVREFEDVETWMKHRTFLNRPKTSGLWLRLKFLDGQVIEGIMPNNLLQAEPAGFSIIPPDPTFQNQRIFVPREAVTTVEVLGVIGSSLRKAKAKPAVEPDKETQLKMFE